MYFLLYLEKEQQGVYMKFLLLFSCSVNVSLLPLGVVIYLGLKTWPAPVIRTMLTFSR